MNITMFRLYFQFEARNYSNESYLSILKIPLWWIIYETICLVNSSPMSGIIQIMGSGQFVSIMLYIYNTRCTFSTLIWYGWCIMVISGRRAATKQLKLHLLFNYNFKSFLTKYQYVTTVFKEWVFVRAVLDDSVLTQYNISFSAWAVHSQYLMVFFSTAIRKDAP